MKTEFTLNPNGWYARLMKYIWNTNSKDFPNMCPFFWLTILNLLIVIPYTLILLFVKVFEVLSSCTKKITDKKKAKREKERHAKMLFYANMSDEHFEDFIKTLNFNDAVYLKKLMGDYSQSAHKWRIAYNHVNRLKETVLNQKMQQKSIRKEKINAMKHLPLAKFLGKLLILISIIGALYLIGKFVIFLTTIPAVTYKQVFIALGFLIGCVSISIILYWIIEKIFKSVLIDINLSPFFKACAKPFIWLFEGFIKIGEIVYVLYKGNCPGIVWKTKK